MKRLLLTCALFLGLAGAANASCGSSLPNVFVNGSSILDANPINANNTFLLNCAKNVDNTQIGAAGIYASQILPTSFGTALFGNGGGSFSGYQFGPYGTGIVPLTINTPTGQTVDLFDIELNATKEFWIDSNGVSNVLSTIKFGSGGSGKLDFGVSNSSQFTFSSPLNVNGTIYELGSAGTISFDSYAITGFTSHSFSIFAGSSTGNSPLQLYGTPVQINDSTGGSGGLQVYDGGATNNVTITANGGSSVIGTNQPLFVQSGGNNNLILRAGASSGTGSTQINYGSGTSGLYLFDGGTVNSLSLARVSNTWSLATNTTTDNLNIASGSGTTTLKIFSGGTAGIYANFGAGGSGGFAIYDGGSTNNVSIIPSAAAAAFTGNKLFTFNQPITSTYNAGGTLVAAVAGGQSLAGLAWNNAVGAGDASIFSSFLVPTNGAVASFWSWNGSAYAESLEIVRGGQLRNSLGALNMISTGATAVTVNYGGSATQGTGGLQIYDGGTTNNVSIVPSSSAAAFTSNKPFTFNQGVQASYVASGSYITAGSFGYSSTAGDLNVGRSATSGVVYFGDSQPGELDYGVSTAGTFSLNKPVQAYTSSISAMGNVAPTYNNSGSALSANTHTVVISSITQSASLNTGCPPHGTWTSYNCGSATITTATFTNSGISATGLVGNTMPSFACGLPWIYYGVTHLFYAPYFNGYLFLDDTTPNVIYFISPSGQVQGGPFVCTGF